MDDSDFHGIESLPETRPVKQLFAAWCWET